MTHLRAIAPDHIRYNGGTRCDMAVGPCACGAWHTVEEAIPQADRHPLDIVRSRIPDIADDETVADTVTRLVRERDQAVELCSTSIALADGHIAQARKERDEARAATLTVMGQLEERAQITVWASQDAPERLQEFVKHDKDWVVWIPKKWFERHCGLPAWLEHGLIQNTVSDHVIDGGVVIIARGPAYLWLR